MQSKALRVATASLFIAALTACGGGGSTPLGTPASTTLTVTGTAATGLAIPGANVTGKCKVGTGTATTLADGSYTLTITDGQLPCVLQITNPVDGIKLHTVVTGTGSTATANITPLTEMATARILGSEPNVFFAAFDAAVATQKITSTTVQAAQTDIGLVLTGTVDTAALGDFISAPLKAATQSSPTIGDAHDKQLDALKLKLTSTQIGTLATALASNQTTDAIKQTVASMMGGGIAGIATPVAPMANAGVAQSVVAGTTVTLDASTSSAAVGKTLTYAWTLTAKPAGSAATLAAPTTAKPTLVTDVAGSYVASVIVNDGTTASSAAAVTVTASVANAAPVANAGVAQNVVAGSSVVTLNGSASSDANSDSLTYAWTLTSKPAGSTAALLSATSATPTFTADSAGIYVVSLVVNDGKVNSTGTTVTVTAGTGMALLPVGSGTFAQTLAKKSYKLDATSGVITIQPSPCQNYIAADVTPDGRVVAIYNLYTFATGYNYESKVAEINILTGACNDLFTLPASGMRGIAVASDGTIVTVGNGRVYRFTASGVQLGQAYISGQSNISVSGISSLSDVDAIDFAPDGTLYATKLSSVWQLDPLTGIGIFKAFGVAGLSDIDIDSAGIFRTLYNEDFQLYSIANWSLISSKTQDNGITNFFGSLLVHR